MVAGSRLLFLGLALLLGIQRLSELRLSRKNEAKIRSLGGYEVGQSHFRQMVALHSAWFAAMLLEVFLLERSFRPGLALGAGLVFIFGQALRYAAITTLGPRWSVRVMILPGAPVVQKGIYRFVRHPNYLGVILEILAVPLIHSAYLTAVLFSGLNAVLLFTRIRVEERALAEANDYERLFKRQKRLIPRVF